MNKLQMCELIHEYNTACSGGHTKENPCNLCWRIAATILIALGSEFQSEGVKPRV